MKKLALKFHSDPGHGWLEVPRKLLDEFGLLHKITSFSYQMGDSVFLEEDCDAGLFLDRMKDLGYEVFITQHTSPRHDSPIRNYQHYSRD